MEPAAIENAVHEVADALSFLPSWAVAAIVLALIASHPRVALVIMSYTYVAFACVMWGVSKLGKRHGGEAARVEEPQERYLE